MSKRSIPKPATDGQPAVKTASVRRQPAARPAVKRKAPVAKTVEPVIEKPADKAKVAKPKLVRDSFTMPEADFALVAALKARALDFKRPAKKSELLRAGLQALAQLDDAALLRALNALTPLKTGRPKKPD